MMLVGIRHVFLMVLSLAKSQYPLEVEGPA
jgi:hypothetical protein